MHHTIEQIIVSAENPRKCEKEQGSMTRKCEKRARKHDYGSMRDSKEA